MTLTTHHHFPAITDHVYYSSKGLCYKYILAAKGQGHAQLLVKDE